MVKVSLSLNTNELLFIESLITHEVQMARRHIRKKSNKIPNCVQKDSNRIAKNPAGRWDVGLLVQLAVGADPSINDSFVRL